MTFLTRGAERALAVHRFHLSARVLFRKMSAQAALAKLPSPLRDLVTSAAQDDDLFYTMGERLARTGVWPRWTAGSEFEAIRAKTAAERTPQ